MMTDFQKILIEKAKEALRKGDRQVARRLAQKALSFEPNNVDAWLLLGGLSSPRASLVFLEKARVIAPDDPRVNQAIAWANDRFAKAYGAMDHSYDADDQRWTRFHPVPPPITIEKQGTVWLWALLIVLILSIFFFSLEFIPSQLVQAGRNYAPIQSTHLLKITLTPSITPSPSPTLSPTPTITPTSTHTLTPTLTATPTETSTTTFTPVPTSTQVVYEMENIGNEEKWVDIDLSDQRLYAYVGDEIVRSFLVSTGTWQYPTPVGQYYVYIRLLYADMYGPGYSLPDVPYTMYFYEDYGIHGTYWHDNFGVPMSHGCVNMRTEDAGWLYNWSYLGILVNIHD
jgi:lipoprotein-anchoring transpeptidase ErfK/SrfK